MKHLRKNAHVWGLCLLIGLALVQLGCNATVGVGVGVAYPGPWHGGPWGGGVYVGVPIYP